MRNVYVAGIGITTFTRLEYPLSEIASYASMMALRDAGVSDIDHLYVANMGSARVNHQTALALSLIHISEPTRLKTRSRMPSSA